jgi:hypothetical protein
MKKKIIPDLPDLKSLQQEMLCLLEGGHTTVYGLNRCINPRINSIYSLNLYQFLTHKHKYLTNVFRDKGDGRYYIGLKEKDGLWYGAELDQVKEKGSKAKVFSYSSARTKDWEDVTRIWWEEYFKTGASALIKKADTVVNL